MLNYWKSKFSTINTPEARSRHAKHLITDLWFVYKDPGAGVCLFITRRFQTSNGAVLQRGQSRGVFRSDLMSIAFAAHLKKVRQVPSRYGDQIGGLALATVAVRFRVLSSFSTVLI